MAADPYRVDTLPVHELVIDLGANNLCTYRLTGTELTAVRAAKPEDVKRMALADVTRVVLATLGGTTICTLHARTGKQLALSSGFERMARDSERERQYVTLLEALNERVATASPDAQFIAGSWAVIAGLALVVAIGAGAVAWLAMYPSFRTSLRFPIVCIIVGMGLLIALPAAILRARPRPYDPRKVPRVYDPMDGGPGGTPAP